MKFEDYKNNTKTLDLTEISNHIKQLSIRNNLNYDDLVEKRFTNSPYGYNLPVNKGQAYTKGLLKHDEIAVAITNTIKDTEMDFHIHEEAEIIKVLSGELHITIDGEAKHILTDGEIIILQPYVAHHAYWPKDTTLIAITLPACQNWPEPVKGS